MRRHGLLPLIALAALAGCGKKASSTDVGDGSAPTDGAGDGRGDGRAPVPCNGRCSGICTGVCTGICSQRTGDGECLGRCEEICVGTCEGICTRSVRSDAGGDAARDGAGDQRPVDGPEADPTVGNWANRANTTTLSWPPVGHSGAMAYDWWRRKMVMFGGATTPVNATWEWDGAAGAWELRQQMNGERPSPRWGHALAFDGGRGRVVMYGGVDESGGSNSETWEWDGEAGTWTRRGQGPTPSRWGHAMSYDGGTGRIVLFGGSYRHPTLGDGDLFDIWEYDGAADTWVNKTYPLPASWPRARRGHAMAYDAARSVTVMYGGEVLAVGGATGDLWEWNGSGNLWADRTPPSLPAAWPGPRAWHGMAFDGGVILLFGGASSLWEYDGYAGTWRNLAPTRGATWPPSRARSPLAFDDDRAVMVLTGGSMMVGSSALADLWEWSRP